MLYLLFASDPIQSLPHLPQERRLVVGSAFLDFHYHVGDATALLREIHLHTCDERHHVLSL